MAKRARQAPSPTAGYKPPPLTQADEDWLKARQAGVLHALVREFRQKGEITQASQERWVRWLDLALWLWENRERDPEHPAWEHAPHAGFGSGRSRPQQDEDKSEEWRYWWLKWLKRAAAIANEHSEARRNDYICRATARYAREVRPDDGVAHLEAVDRLLDNLRPESPTARKAVNQAIRELDRMLRPH